LGEAQARGDGHAIAYALRELARLRCRQGERELSAELLGQSLALLQPLKDIRCAQICLEDLAGAISERRPADVARLFGASDALLGLMGTSLSAAQRSTREHEVATVESQLDPQSFAEAWAEGRAMSLEQAIEYALGEANTA
jgi:hypothetical protein